MTGSPEFRSWMAAKVRCKYPDTNENKKYYEGVKMHPLWENDFLAFYAELGPRPDGKSLDRIDGTRGYEPGNCRWASAREQNLNQRRRKKKT